MKRLGYILERDDSGERNCYWLADTTRTPVQWEPVSSRGVRALAALFKWAADREAKAFRTGKARR